MSTALRDLSAGTRAQGISMCYPKLPAPDLHVVIGEDGDGAVPSAHKQPP
jgi:hypothetical protein